ncbi:hypothetical protein [Cellulosimicrobium protaetiae]|uniref:Uncharacterized protein n=1 Tax=Cellulosimicrobium protaetiae TaxID=2587808 RepID=A0A6M5UJK9_9MICO|nr:hypothetical protein [Cellulosimicrobium protaetiae]QJW37268.1 hypothetical protein FIC82_014845 [Cellulosimicrobium protaetiae]
MALEPALVTAPAGSPRVRRLPERAVLVELSGSADAVETDPESLPEHAPVAAWRRWGWAVAFVPTVALLVYQRLATGRGWSVPEAVVVVATVGLLVTALLALVRYQDDRVAAGLARGRAALLAAPVRATGTLLLPGDAAAGPTADATAGTADGTRTGTPAGRGTRAATAGPEVLRSTLVVTTASGARTARPARVVVPTGAAGPRPGDPVAVWHAADDAEATGVLLVRYHRAWADDLVATLRGLTDAAPPEDPSGDRAADGRGERPENPADPRQGAE